MREFLFPDGDAWVLVRYLPESKAQFQLLETAIGTAIPLFSDGDLAQTYSEAMGESGYVPTVLAGAERVIAVLAAQQKCGVFLVAIDPTCDREVAFATNIEKVIEYVRMQSCPDQPYQP